MYNCRLMSTTVDRLPPELGSAEPADFQPHSIVPDPEGWRPTLGQAGMALVLGTVTAVDLIYLRPRGFADRFEGTAQAGLTSIDHLGVGAMGAYAGYKYALTRDKIVGEVAPAIYERAFKYALVGATAMNFGAESGQAVFNGSPEKFFLNRNQIPETSKDYLFALGGLAIFYGQKAIGSWLEKRRSQEDKSSLTARFRSRLSSDPVSAPELPE